MRCAKVNSPSLIRIRRSCCGLANIEFRGGKLLIASFFWNHFCDARRCQMQSYLVYDCRNEFPLLTNDLWRAELSGCIDQANQAHLFELAAFVYISPLPGCSTKQSQAIYRQTACRSFHQDQFRMDVRVASTTPSKSSSMRIVNSGAVQGNRILTH